MIIIKSDREIEIMRQAGRIVAGTLNAVGKLIKPGVTTMELDEVAEDYIRSHDAIPAFKGYGGFPASICTSVNCQVVHGIPDGDVVLRDGDLISIDAGAIYDGYCGDAARTFAVGNVSEEVINLIDATEKSFFECLKYARKGYRLSDISHAVQTYIESKGYSVVRSYVGHGIGQQMHEDPQIPNYGPPNKGVRLREGMTFAIEPMVNIGGYDVYTKDDGWTVITSDGSLSSHYENTIVLTDSEPIILTMED